MKTQAFHLQHRHYRLLPPNCGPCSCPLIPNNPLVPRISRPYIRPPYINSRDPVSCDQTSLPNPPSASSTTTTTATTVTTVTSSNPTRPRWPVSASAVPQCFIIDATAILNHVQRAFRASAPLSRKSVSTRAIHAFAIVMTSILKEHAKDAPVITVFATPPSSSSTSPASSISHAIASAIRICHALGLSIVQQASTHPHDIIATLACTARRSGVRSVIVSVSGAIVIHQLVHHPWVRMLMLHRAGTFQNVTERDPALRDLFGADAVHPRQIVDVIALAGDNASGVPGISGIGKRTAVKLITRFSTLGHLLNAARAVATKPTSRLALSAQRRSHGTSLTPRLASRLVDNERHLMHVKKSLTAREDISLPDVTWQSLQRNFVNADEVANIAAALKISDQSVVDQMLRSGDDVSPDYQKIKSGNNLSLASVSDLPIKLTSDKFMSDNSIHENAVNSTTDHIEHFLKTVHDCVALLPIFDDNSAGHRLLSLSACARSGHAIFLYESKGSVFANGVVRLFTNAAVEKRGWFLKQLYKCLLSEHGIRMAGVLFDNHVASRLLYAGNEVNDMAIAKQYLPTNSFLAKWLRVNDCALLSSNILADWSLPLCREAFELANYLRQGIMDTGLAAIMFVVEAPLVPVLADMEMAGVPIDLRRLQTLHDKLRELRITLRSSLQSLISKPRLQRNGKKRLRLSSQQDVFHFLFPTQPSLSTSSSTSKDKSLQSYKRSMLHPRINERTLIRLTKDESVPSSRRQFARLLLLYRKVSQLMRMHTTSLLDNLHHDTRVRPTFVQNAAASGRISTSKPNLQSLPIRSLIGGTLRRTVKARDGAYIISADYSQIELRIVASMSKDENLVTAFTRDIDVHMLIAQEMFGVATVAQVTDEQRTMAKQVVYSIMYGISSKGLSERLRIPRRDAKLLISQFFKRFPDVQRLTDRLVDEAGARGFASTLLGRRQRLVHIVNGTERQRHSARRVAMNMPIQGTQADMLKLAMSGIWLKLQKSNLQSRLIMQMHDELILEVEGSERDHVIHLVLEQMVRASPLNSVDVLVKIGSGKTWLEASNSAVVRKLHLR